MKKKVCYRPVNFIVPFALGIVLAVFLFGIITSAQAARPVQQVVLATGTNIIQKSSPIVAVNSDESQGFVGNVTIKLIPGSSNVLVDTTPFVEPDVQYSGDTAVAVAKLESKNAAANQDFVLTYSINADVVGGGSAGAATTIAAIAALENRNLVPGVAITGTINPDGTIGPVGGLYEKAKAVADAGYRTFLIPYGQSEITSYDQVVTPQKVGGFTMYSTAYIPKTINLKEEALKWNLNVVEVSSIQDAMHYMLK
jgi:predicted S18 family serine protease